MTAPLYQKSAHELGSELRSKKLSPQTLLESLTERIRKIDLLLKAYIAFDGGSSVPKNLPEGPLYGLPVAIKDNICVKDRPTTCGSKILTGFSPPYHATVVSKLLAAGAIPFGRTNMDEFAFGSSCETSCYGATRNPWDLERIPGGSSGGSAAAIAADEAILSLGSDTGGSIRQPAALCGVVGLKPTYGRISRYGLVAFASSLDQIGPITKDVTDCALLLRVIAGHDPKDSTSADLPVPDYTKSLQDNVKGLTIGIPKEYFVKGLDREVEEAVRSAIEALARLGAKVKEVSLPNTPHATSVYYIVAPAEASSNLARFDGVQYGFRKEEADLLATYGESRSQGFGPEVKRRIMLGTYALSSGYYDAWYLKALKVRTLVKRDFDRTFESCDCLIVPTSPTAAFRLGEKMDDPLSMYLSDIYTIPANLAGIPALALPCGFTRSGLPIGLQLLAKPFGEETLLRVGFTFEQNTEFHLRPPKGVPS